MKPAHGREKKKKRCLKRRRAVLKAASFGEGLSGGDLAFERKGGSRMEQVEFPSRLFKQTKLGIGFTGDVWAARDLLHDGEMVAVKTLSRKLYEKHALSFPPLEVELGRELAHPNIVRVLDVIAEPERILLILQYLPGGDLFACMQETGVFSEFLARCCFNDLVAGTTYIHAQGVAHRDLKGKSFSCPSHKSNHWRLLQ